MDATERHPVRRTGDLHRSRWSTAGSRYFITCCLHRPAGCLLKPDCATALHAAWRIEESSGDIRLDCATIMPDHIHALLTLGDRLQLGRIVAKFKALTRAAVLENGGAWQRDFYEHRLQADDHASPFARYIFLNPYRAGLLERRAHWPHWHLHTGLDFDFLTLLEAGQFPLAEWLTLPWGKLDLNPAFVGSD